MTTPHEYAQTNAEDYRSQLRDLIRMPSVSTDPAYADDVRKTAEWLVAHINNIGLSAELIETDKHPLVYADWMNAGDSAPTILIYGHYDVQPAVMEDGWDHDPFDPIEKDGKIFARGADDNKGQFFAHIKAIESILKADGKLTFNVKFILEGEEESGGKSIAKFVPENTDKLKADVCVVSDSSFLDENTPSILYGLRGSVAMELHITGPSSDLHSGSYGGVVHNPLQALTEIVSQLHNKDGHITVPGFYDDVVVLSDDERAELAKTTWTDEAFKAETGAPQAWGESEFTYRERVGARPTLEINGLAGGYAGAGFKTVLPSKALAKISCRLVANQDPKKIYALIKKYVAEITPPTVTSELVYLSSGYSALVDLKDPALQAAVTAFEKGFGTKPVFMREGGSIPVVADFQKHLGLPVVLMGFGLPTNGIHGPNEHFVIDMFHKGIDTAIHFYHDYVAQNQ